MMRDLVIGGHSGFAKEIEWLVQRINREKERYRFMGFIDKEVGGEVIGDDNWLVKHDKEIDVVIAISDAGIKRNLYEMYCKNNKLSFPTVIDPSVLIGESSQYGMGNIICVGTILTTEIQIGNFNIINLDCTVGHEAIIGDYVTLNPSVNISGNVIIEDDVNIGTGTQVIPGVRIGNGSTVGAGAVVTNDIPAHCLAVGVPARVVKRNEA